MDNQLLRLLELVAGNGIRENDGEVGGKQEGKGRSQTFNNTHTHITQYGPRAKWNFKKHTYSLFWKGYCNIVADTAEEAAPALCLAEKPQKFMPVVSKLTLKCQMKEEDSVALSEMYDETFLFGVCQAYQEVINKHFVLINEVKAELIAVTLEASDCWYEEDDKGNKYAAAEIRIQFPYAKIEASLQNRVIRPAVIRLLRERSVLENLKMTGFGKWEDIISSESVNEPLAMYGSNDVLNRPVLGLTHIWGHTMNDDPENVADATISSIEIEDAFFPANHTHITSQLIEENMFEENTDVNHWLPLFLSTDYAPYVLAANKVKVIESAKSSTSKTNSITTDPQMTSQPAPGLAPRLDTNFGKRRIDVRDETTIDLCRQMLRMINYKRFLQKVFWLDIGKALYHADAGGDDGLEEWVTQTDRAIKNAGNLPSFLEQKNLKQWGNHTVGSSMRDICRSIYDTFSSSAITVKTLAWYAREDNPKPYSVWHEGWCMASMEQALSALDNDVALAMYRVYWLDFVYSPIGLSRWYFFNKHRWEEDNRAIDLRKEISNGFRNRFEHLRVALLKLKLDNGEDTADNVDKNLTALIKKLRTGHFKRSLLNEMCEQFNDKKFEGLLDTNPDITGMKNGVIEIQDGVALFRQCKPEDYISMCTNIPYHSNYHYKHHLVVQCMEWLRQVFTDESLLEHFIKFASSVLRGRNSDKIFPIFTGGGDNSKSMIVKLFESTLGMYCIKFDISNITSKNNNASGPSPQLARAKSTRIAFMDEPEDDVPMNKGVIKRWVGGDSFFARMLHNDGGDVKVTFKLVLSCNKVPIIPNADEAIMRRTKIFPFLSKWVKEKYPTDPAEQMKQGIFQMDTNFEQKIPVLAPAFMWILTQYYPIYSKYGLIEPQIITDYTQTYWKDNDIYAQFCADHIQVSYIDEKKEVLDTNVRETLDAIYNEFKLWHRDAIPGASVPNRATVRSTLSSRFWRLEGGSWPGISLMSAGVADMSTGIGGRGEGAKAKPITKESVIAKGEGEANEEIILSKGEVNVMNMSAFQNLMGEPEPSFVSPTKAHMSRSVPPKPPRSSSRTEPKIADIMSNVLGIGGVPIPVTGGALAI